MNLSNVGKTLCLAQALKHGMENGNGKWNRNWVGHTYSSLSGDPRQPQVQDNPPDI